MARTPDFLDLAGANRVPAAKRNVAWDAVLRRTRAESSRGPALSAFVDTNILVRHLTGDPPAMAERATRYLAAERNLLLADLVVAETGYVLEFLYEAPRVRWPRRSVR